MLSMTSKSSSSLRRSVNVAKQPSFNWTWQGVDLLTLDEDRGVLKALMNCGHVISRESLKSYCTSELNKGRTTIRCPSHGCDSMWPYSTCRSILSSLVTHAEMSNMDEKINRNFAVRLDGVEQCPGCRCFLEKMAGDSSDRVSCPLCLAEGRDGDFCWSCKMPWRSNSDESCANKGCDKGAKKLMILAGCPEVEIEGRKTPSVRGCPRCGLLIEYKSACTQMNCPDCGTFFCFYCLREARTKKDLVCIPYRSKCIVVPRQKTLPNCRA